MIGRTDPSLKVPFARNCSEAPTLIVGFAGPTAIECRVAFVTVRVVVPLSPLNTAVIVVVPGATPVTTPLLSFVLLIVATDGEDEVHVTAEVRFRV